MKTQNNMKNSILSNINAIRYARFIIMIAFAFLFAAIAAVAQVDTTTVVVDPVSGLPTEEIMKGWFKSIGSVGAVTLAAVALIRSKWNVRGFALHWSSWAIAVVLSWIGYWFGWGAMATLGSGVVGFLWTTLFGVMSGAAANGIADWQVFQLTFGLLKSKA